MTPHPQAEILRAIADGKTVQRSNDDYEWVDASLKCLVNYPTGAFRIKPEIINGIEVPAPVRKPLKDGSKYFLVDINNQELAAPDVWRGGEADNRWLKRGLIHLTKEAAIAHAEALLSFTRSDK